MTRSMKGAEAITQAIQEGELEQVRALMEANPALLGLSAGPGIPITLWAAYYRQWEVFVYLIGLRQEMSIYEAVAGGREEETKTLLAENPALVNAFASDGFTPLGLACYFNRSDIVRLLISHGADVNLAALNPTKVAPIHSAVAANSMPITSLLLEHKAMVNATQMNGITALHSAAHRGKEELVRLLLEHDADKTARSEDGRTALDFAKEGGHQAIIDLLSP